MNAETLINGCTVGCFAVGSAFILALVLFVVTFAFI